MQVPNLVAEVLTDRTQYPPSRAVEIETHLTNTGRILQQIAVSNGFEVELAVRNDRTGKVIWNWSKGRQRPRPYSFRLAPGQTRFNQEIWDRRDDSGRPAPAGVYRVEATLTPLRRPVVARIYLVGPGGAPGGGRPGDGEDPGEGPGTPQGLVGTLRADRSVARPGETVAFVYTVVNRAKAPRTLRFRSGQRFDIEVSRRPEPNARYAKGALTVWQASRETAYLLALGEMVFAPGETKTFQAAWKVPQGIPVAEGDARAWLTSFDTPEAASATLPLRLAGG